MLRCPKCGHYLAVCICGRRAVLIGTPFVLVTVLARTVNAQGTTGSAGASVAPSGTTRLVAPIEPA
ncbi:MAG TPA: hypothetical protein VN903_13510 [Polyangia bacterium]|nr:hypothetical protein [Polyangia bacterium]